MRATRTRGELLADLERARSDVNPGLVRPPVELLSRVVFRRLIQAAA